MMSDGMPPRWRQGGKHSSSIEQAATTHLRDKPNPQFVVVKQSLKDTGFPETRHLARREVRKC